LIAWYEKNNAIFVPDFVNQGLKKISTILLLALTFAPAICPFVLQSQQRSIQHKMKERLEEDMLHTVTMAKAEMHWVKPGKEILLGGEMFDVKDITEQGNGIVVVTGLYDFEETLLVGQMKKKQQDDNTNGNKQLGQAFQLLQAMPEDLLGDSLTPQLISCSWSSLKDDDLSSPFKNILTPPPQV
jgi:hypothetical protein